jgi:hypothetical protein
VGGKKREAMKAEIEGLKNDKIKLDYAVFDLVKHGFVYKDKLERIRAIYNE